jgi:hypothetical protein
MITPEDLATCGSESGHQKALFQWCALNIKQYPQLKWLYAVPNGFFSSSGQKAKMKAEGLKDGVPDICLPWPISKLKSKEVVKDERTYFNIWYHGLYIELKIEKRRNQKDGGCSKEQLEWLAYLEEVGYFVAVCYGWQDAKNVIVRYLNG